MDYYLVSVLQDYGFPMFAAVAMGYFIYTFITTQIKVKLGQANTVLIALIDRIRMLDNDIIRLKSKVKTTIELKENLKKSKNKD